MTDFTDICDVLDDRLRTAVEDDPLGALLGIGEVQRVLAGRQKAAVRAAVRTHSWAEVGQAMAVSRQAAHQRFAKEWSNELKEEITAAHRELQAAKRAGDAERTRAAQARRDGLVAEVRRAGGRRP